MIGVLKPCRKEPSTRRIVLAGICLNVHPLHVRDIRQMLAIVCFKRVGFFLIPRSEAVIHHDNVVCGPRSQRERLSGPTCPPPTALWTLNPGPGHQAARFWLSSKWHLWEKFGLEYSWLIAIWSEKVTLEVEENFEPCVASWWGILIFCYCDNIAVLTEVNDTDSRSRLQPELQPRLTAHSRPQVNVWHFDTVVSCSSFSLVSN